MAGFFEVSRVFPFRLSYNASKAFVMPCFLGYALNLSKAK